MILWNAVAKRLKLGRPDPSASNFNQPVHVTKFNVQRYSETAVRYGVQNVPLIVLFASNRIIHYHMRGMECCAVVDWAEEQRRQAAARQAEAEAKARAEAKAKEAAERAKA